VKWPKAVILVLLSIVVRVAGAQSSQEADTSAPETQARGYWVDPSTGLMWAGKDNGRDISWKNAMKYCRNLRLAGSSDWRLGTVEELEGIYDKNDNAPGRSGPSEGRRRTWHVKGNLFLTGIQWSSSQRIDDRGHPNGYVWYFRFDSERSDYDNDPTGFPYPFNNRRALCVRGLKK
jgi:hypothetical protein